ncbi:MAG: hypothetical protein NWQ13_00810, partial [Glaciimonas sp.]|nr:hypothetical protein [Glaciimonas sp.]
MIANKTEASPFTTSFVGSASPPLKRYSLVIGISLIITLATGVVLSQVLQSPKPMPIAPASLAPGLLTAMPEAPIKKGAGSVIVQNQQREWIAERAGLQRDIERLQDDVTRLQAAYDA